MRRFEPKEGGCLKGSNTAADGAVMESDPPENGGRVPEAERVEAPALESESCQRESNLVAASEMPQAEDSSDDDDEIADALGELTLPDSLPVESTVASPPPPDDWTCPMRWEVCNSCENADRYANWVKGLQELVEKNELSNDILDSLYNHLTHVIRNSSDDEKQGNL